MKSWKPWFASMIKERKTIAKLQKLHRFDVLMTPAEMFQAALRNQVQA
jgi:hypothetical protein